MLVFQWLSIVVQTWSHKTADFNPSAIDFTKVVFFVFIREKAFQGISKPFYISLVPWKISKALCEVEIKAAASLHHALELYRTLDAGSLKNES